MTEHLVIVVATEGDRLRDDPHEAAEAIIDSHNETARVNGWPQGGTMTDIITADVRPESSNFITIRKGD